jgi:YfiH family protein
MTDPHVVLTLGPFDELPGVRHAFFTRRGGVSSGLYASLNAGYGTDDDPAKVARNRALAMESLGLGPDALVTAYQVHGTAVAVVDAPLKRGRAPRADGLVTQRPGLALGMLTADCAAVLFADSEAGVVGAAHAGWRGAKDGVIEAVIGKMCELGAKRGNIAAAIGPCIAKESYEVGPEFPKAVLGRPLAAGDQMGGAVAAESGRDLFAPAPRARHYLFDLAGYVVGRCRAAGVTKTALLPADTFREEERFFSYRRALVRGEPDYGRCLSVILLEG